jgi:hypothetical protein
MSFDDKLCFEHLRKVKGDYMTRSKTLLRLPSLVLAAIALSAIIVASALADPVINLSGAGSIVLSADGLASFVLKGNGSHLGKYDCYGEFDFTVGEETGGVAAIRAANGDVIVGVVTVQIDEQGNGLIHFSWRDSVRFSDGTVVSSSGRFVRSRPAGAVSRFSSISDGTSNIIAILIG